MIENVINHLNVLKSMDVDILFNMVINDNSIIHINLKFK